MKLGKKKLIHGKLNHTFLSEINEGEGKLRPQVSFWYFKVSLVWVYPGKLWQGLVQNRHPKGEHFLKKKGRIRCVVVRNNFIPLS